MRADLNLIILSVHLNKIDIRRSQTYYGFQAGLYAVGNRQKILEHDVKFDCELDLSWVGL